MMQPLPSIAQAYRLFAREERHKEMSQITGQTESLAFFTDRRKSNPFPSQRNFKQNSGSEVTYHNTGGGFPKPNSGNGTKNAFKKGGKPNYFCNHCKIPDHSMERCFKLHDYPPGFFNKKIAAVSQTIATGDNESSLSDANPTVTLEQ